MLDAGCALNKYACISFTVGMCLTIFIGRELLIVPVWLLSLLLLPIDPRLDLLIDVLMFQPVKELNRTCRAMQQRVVELISRVSNEEVTEELLHVNDDLNNIFLRYERYSQTGRHTCATQYSFIHFFMKIQ